MSGKDSIGKAKNGPGNRQSTVKDAAAFEGLKKQSFRGGTITAAFQVLSVSIQLASTATLARLLSPEEFGVVGMALTLVAFARLFRDLGLSSATIQRATLTHDQLSTLYWLNIVAGALLTFAVSLCSPLVSWFFGRPELTTITIVTSLTFFIGSFSIQQSALMIREMQFGRRETASVVGSLSSFIVSAIFAMEGHGFWSLVYGNLAGSVVGSGMIIVLSKWKPGPPRLGTGIRPMLKYGASLTAFDFVNYFSRNLDSVLIGRVSGAEALAQYSKAYQLLMMPITNLRRPINAVAFPALSRLQSQPREFRSYYCSVVGLLAMVSMPAVAWLYVVSDSLILVVLGPQWQTASELFSILAVAAFLQTSAGFRGSALMSLGMGRRYFWQGLIGAIVTCAGFGVGIMWGVTGVAYSYAITTVLMTYPMHVYSFRGMPVTATDFLRSIKSAALASMIAAAATCALRSVAWEDSPAIVDLAFSSLCFVTICMGLLAAQPDSRRKLLRGWTMAKDRLNTWADTIHSK